jgi:hypothetical protein
MFDGDAVGLRRATVPAACLNASVVRVDSDLVNYAVHHRPCRVCRPLAAPVTEAVTWPPGIAGPLHQTIVSELAPKALFKLVLLVSSDVLGLKVHE